MTITMTITTLASIGTPVNAADVTGPDNQLLTLLNNIANAAQDVEALRYIEITTPSNPAATKHKLYFTSTGPKILDSGGSEQSLLPYPSQVCNARMTLTTGTAVTTGDVTAATHLYVTPFRGNRIALYDGTNWAIYTLAEIDISLALQAADKNYDVFAYVSSGSVVAETVVWTNDTARATALALQDGVYVKSGSVTKRYIGTYRTTSTIGQCEDSLTKRYVWNYYNRVERDFYLIEATNSWTYATATWRSWNSSANNRFSFVRGVNEDAVDFRFVGAGSCAGGVYGNNAFGLDSTTTPSGLFSGVNATGVLTAVASYNGKPSEGFHFVQVLEIATGATVTFYGDNGGTSLQSGAIGKMAA